ncbi:MAG TPA: ABC transporter ATP-binding protein [Acidimicrobiales bacterium]|nr:ABC transporter ATP-binding protein [Acidimicrobiales bacterium]
MREFMFRPGGPNVADPDPLPLREALAAAAGALRLAWEADPAGLAVVVAVNLATAGAEVAQLLSSGRAVEAVIDGGKARSQTRGVVTVGALSLLAVAGKQGARALQNPIEQRAFRRAEGRILDVVASLELADVEDPAFQDRLQRALMGAQRQTSLVGNALEVPGALIELLAGMATMTSSDRALVPLGLVGVVPRWLLNKRSPDPMHAMRMRSREGRETAVLRHYLTGSAAAHELRLFDATPYLRRRHDDLAEEAAAAQAVLVRQNGRRQVLSALAARAADAPAAARLLLRVTRKETSVGDAVTGGMAARRVAGGFQRLVDTATGLRRTAALAADALTFARDSPAPRTGPAPPRDFRRISVEDLHFTYPGADRPVLAGVDLHVDRGEVVALVGENGCGKTTLAKILCSLYAPTKGGIRWDDIDVTECDPAAVRSHIAVVFQDFVRYPSLTAAQNIGIGQPARMDDRAAIVAAARSAGADAAIAALPEGYDTVMARQFGGSDLSTGQWQRVALARAFLRDSPLVVLDEPTAALDPRAERDLFETVASLYQSRSAILISHRLSSVRFADRICVLAGGRISETGTHEELLEAGGAYAELFELQAHAYR